ncbi:MAG: hypothetical protein RL385_735 [Pseudomonadota bacterium]|jgi:predicted branched-subunit amino acid permease
MELLRHPEFRAGFRDEARVMPGMLAWGLVTGVAMVKGGLSTGAALVMALLVFSAGGQLGAVAMLATHTPVWIIVATTVCVNLRFVVFSAGLRPYLVHLPFWRRVLLGYVTADLSYILFMQRFGKYPAGEPGQLPYLVGLSSANWLGWQLATVLGILFSDAIPAAWGLDYAGVLALLGLACSLMQDRASVAAGFVGGAVSLLAYNLPLRLNVVAAIIAAIATGMLLERRTA